MFPTLTTRLGGRLGQVVNWGSSLVLLVAGTVPALYVAANYETVVARAGMWTDLDLWMAGFGLLFVLEAARRTNGWALPTIALAALLYARFGYLAPEVIAHNGYSLQRIATQLYLTGEGVFGIAVATSASMLYMFILFGHFLLKSGAGDFMTTLSFSACGRVRGGPAKASVVASSLFGSISGSPVANVIGTGSVTIPLMKRMGYQPHFAGAVEAVASTGGQLVPPVMGAGAFIMAEILGLPYWQIMVAAAIPALTYYAAVFLEVDLEAQKEGLRAVAGSEMEPVRRVLRKGWPFIIPFVVLIYLIAVVLYSPGRAALVAIAVLFGITMLLKGRRMDVRKTWAALADTGRAAVQIVGACACMGIIIGVVLLTGLGFRLSSLLIALSGGNLLALLVLTMFASMMLGLGLPTVASYLILAILVAPTLVTMGVPPLAAHMFVFYFGILANITPPVALAAYVAAGIAGANPLKTGAKAVQLGVAGFLVPYALIYNSGVLLMGGIGHIADAITSVSVGAVAIAFGVYGEGFGLRFGAIGRMALTVAAVMLTVLSGIVQLPAYAAVAMIGGYGWLRRTKAAVPHVAPET
jgi:TRAP transporter 4TM/12TM fusion protein